MSEARIRRLERQVSNLRELVSDQASLITSLQLHLKNLFSNATVQEYDPKTHHAIAEDITDDEEDGNVKSPMIPVLSQAGKIKKRTTLDVGEQVLMFNPNGRVDETSFMLPFGPNEANSSPSQEATEDITTCGITSVRQNEDKVELIAGGTNLTLSADGFFASHAGNSLDITDEVLAKGKIRTDGPTRLNNGNRPAHYKGGKDSAGDVALDGADGVFI